MMPKLPKTTPITREATRGETLANFQWIVNPTKVTAKAKSRPGRHLRTATITLEL
jgi:hypothetical protein